jgi:NAD(P)-dependent dehydrogenase (short-subunit alcohol dehydrogenase family)
VLQAAAEGGSLAVELDVRDLDSVDACLAAAADAYGGVDVWVNNARRDDRRGRSSRSTRPSGTT